MITRKQGIAYAAITLDLLYKMNVKIEPKTLASQMNLVYDLYKKGEIEKMYKKLIN